MRVRRPLAGSDGRDCRARGTCLCLDSWPGRTHFPCWAGNLEPRVRRAWSARGRGLSRALGCVPPAPGRVRRAVTRVPVPLPLQTRRIRTACRSSPRSRSALWSTSSARSRCPAGKAASARTRVPGPPPPRWTHIARGARVTRRHGSRPRGCGARCPSGALPAPRPPAHCVLRPCWLPSPRELLFSCVTLSSCQVFSGGPVGPCLPEVLLVLSRLRVLKLGFVFAVRSVRAESACLSHTVSESVSG